MATNRMFVPELPVEWLPPPKGTIKLNFDGGLCSRRGCAVSAGIFRDHNGIPIYSYVVADHAITGYTPYEGEAKALAMGLQFGLQLERLYRETNRGHEFAKLWVEGDAKLLIDVARAERPNHLYDKGTISEIQDMMALFGDNGLMLTFIEREGNAAADALVRHTRDDVLLRARSWDWDQQLPNKVGSIIFQERDGYTYFRQARFVRRPKNCYVPPASPLVV